MSGEPIFTPANAVTSNYQTDYWHHEDPGDVGRASVSAPQMQQSFQQAQPLPLCRATCDFNPEEMNLEGSQYCLNFLKVCKSSQTLLSRTLCSLAQVVDVQMVLSKSTTTIIKYHNVRCMSRSFLHKLACDVTYTANQLIWGFFVPYL